MCFQLCNIKIQGKMYHRIGKLLADKGESPRCGQMYFYSPGDQ